MVLMWFSVACFGVSVSVISPYICFIVLLARFGLLSDHLLGNSWPLAYAFVFIVFCLFVILVTSHYGFENGVSLLIAPVPVHCFLITFNNKIWQFSKYIPFSCSDTKETHDQSLELWVEPTKSLFVLVAIYLSASIWHQEPGVNIILSPVLQKILIAPKCSTLNM